jgi:superfamily II DNA or RNA helicase
VPSLTVSEPALVRLNDLSPVALDRARKYLTFEDGGIAYLLSKHRKNFRWKRNDPEGWEAHKEELDAKRKRCALFEDSRGFYTYSGLADELSQALVCGAPVERPLVAPEPRGMPWEHEPEHEARYYQDGAEKALLEAMHGAIELGTGLGKSRILLDLTHHLGLRTLIVAPSASILTQLVKDFERALGKRYVGQYGDGKKKFDRQVTIATFQSLTRLAPGDEAWEELSKCEAFMVDESHMCPASTLEKVCMGVARDAKYRFFVSATQVRGDGSAIVLRGIIGRVVYTMSVAEGVDQGFLAKPHFKMIRVPSQDADGNWDRFESLDIMKMTRKHHYYNPRIIEKAAKMANMAVQHLKHKVLIQVEEIGQFKELLRHLEHEPRFAHGAAASDPDLRGKVPEKYWKSDPAALAEAFNNEEFPILVGTSCIGVGTDIKVPETIINLMGGCSNVGIPQAVGRGTRRHVFKDGHRKSQFNFIDFVPMLRTRSFNDTPETQDEKVDATQSPMYRHGLMRAKMYQDLYPNVRWV